MFCLISLSHQFHPIVNYFPPKHTYVLSIRLCFHAHKQPQSGLPRLPRPDPLFTNGADEMIYNYNHPNCIIYHLCRIISSSFSSTECLCSLNLPSLHRCDIPRLYSVLKVLDAFTCCTTPAIRRYSSFEFDVLSASLYGEFDLG